MAGESAVGFALDKVKREQEFRHPNQYRDHHCQLKDLPIGEPSLQLAQQAFINWTIRRSVRKQSGKLERGLFAVVERSGLKVP